MILPLDSRTVNSPAGPSATGFAFLLPSLPPVSEDAPLVCSRCGLSDPSGESVIERHDRRASASEPLSSPPLVAYCPECAEALGLSWCVGCQEWMPAGEVGADDELCAWCRADASPRLPESSPCPDCGGAGRVGAISCGSGGCLVAPVRCRRCGGEGRVSPARAAAVAEGRRLREDRIGRGLSLGEMAEHLGLDPRELNRRERGEG